MRDGNPRGQASPDDGWHRWTGVNGLRYARRPRTSPPLVIRDTDPLGLDGEIALAEALGPGDYARYRLGLPLLNGQPPQAPAPAMRATPPTLVPGPVQFQGRGGP